jgi:aspartate racemase
MNKGACHTKRLGIIGGLGPLATAYFYELIVMMTEAKTDQEHLEIILYNCPSIPDRTAHILGHSPDNPATQMADIGFKLAALKADIIAIPCITAHYYHSILTKQIPIPIIHGMEAVARHLQMHQIQTAGLMATEGTVYSGVFQKALNACGIQVLLPSAKGQEDINHIIYKNVKANCPIELDKFQAAASELKLLGSQVIILGCTELSLVKQKYHLGSGYLDALEVLSREAILMCDAKLRSEYDCLIT